MTASTGHYYGDDDPPVSAYEEMVKHLGKFEGEQPWTPYFYDAILNGSGDTLWSCPDGGGCADAFEINDEDITRFPALAAHYGVILHERSDGFVIGRLYETQKEYEAARAEWEAMYVDDDDDSDQGE